MNCSNDLTIRTGEAVYYFKFLDWDTNFFGLNCFLFDEDKSNIIPDDGTHKLFEKHLKKTFITAKIKNSLQKEKFNFMQSLGFKYIDVEITLQFQPGFNAGRQVYPEVVCEKLILNNGLPYNEMGSSFANTRFHSDAKISTEKANLLWIEYLKNYAPGAKNHIFAAKISGQIASVILVNEEEPSDAARIFFVATEEKFQGKGTGSCLIQYTLNYLRGKRILVGTQGKNIKALNFYLKNGFTRVAENKVIMHRWSD